MSIGTGVEDALDRNESYNNDDEQDPDEPPGIGHLKRLKTIVNRKMDDMMDSEKAWCEFVHQRCGPVETKDQKNFRLNVNIAGALPALDRVKDMESLEREATRFCKVHHNLIGDVAAKMIASLFYMELGCNIPDTTSISSAGSMEILKFQGMNPHNFTAALYHRALTTLL